MTLIVAVNRPETIWLMADRRLSFRNRPPRDDARKLMLLEATDGIAILGYAGLGATAAGTEPADWMSAVLRGRALPLEHSLGVLADAMQREFPPHLRHMPGCPAHHLLATAFVGEEVRLYSIDMVFAPNRSTYRFRYTRHVVERPARRAPVTPPLGIAGSGAHCLTQDQGWMRELLRVVRANEYGRVSTSAVASHLARLNSQVHLRVSDGTVGPGCIVAWRHRKGSVHKGGGGHQFFTGIEPDADSSSLPTIANGLDVNALVGAMMPRFMRMAEAFHSGQPREDWDKDEINAELALLPDAPDEKLR